MIHHILLLCMVLSYSFVIYTVKQLYINDYSISSIICDDKCNKNIILYMSFMTFFTFMYELMKDDNISLFLITSLIVGIMGVLKTNEKQFSHLIYSIIAFGSILCFMFYMSFQYNNIVLITSFIIQIVLALFMMIFIFNNIFYIETGFLVNFAFFYIYLHFLL